MKHKIWIIPATGLLFTLTACGGGGSNSNAGATPPSSLDSLASAAADGSESPAAGASSGGDSGSVDVCSVLPVADVSRITGTAYTTAKRSSVAGQIFECEYGDSTYDLLQISVAVVNGSLDYDSDTQAMSALEKPIPVSGVGDKAFTVKDPQGNAGAAGVAAFASYGALFGDQYVKIGGSYVTPDQGKQIVEEIHGKM